jgi:primosomal protein N' (replication factor Y)
MLRYADVALPVGLEREFTYSIPAELEATAQVGVRVIVPFGRKVATGIIVSLSGTTSHAGIKPIREILDGAPILSPAQMRLCRWIAEYYIAPLGDVIRSANPGAFTRPSRRSVTLLVPMTPEEIAQIPARQRNRKAVLRLLAERGTLTSAELQKETGIRGILTLLNEMERDGVIRTEELLSLPKAAIRSREFILFDSVQVEKIVERLEQTPARNVRARELLATLLRMREKGEDFPVSDVLTRSGAPLSAFKKLAAAGLAATTLREVPREQEFETEEQTLRIVLNEDQQRARDSVVEKMAEGGGTFLLHGVTGSGKTQVYIECIRQALAHGRSAIVLVPEISLTPQTVRRFRSHFGDLVAVVHSRMSTDERREVWQLAQRGERSVVIGPRSAVFAPVRNPGLIVVDEEHEASYKQFDASPRYHARDVAVVRGMMESAVVLLGSATPSIESYQNARSGKYTLLELPRRIDDVPMPVITVVDLAAERKREYAAAKEALPREGRAKLKEFKQSSVSTLLREKITERLQRQEGIILLQNRRGFAPFVECPECGYSERCENCNVTLTYHLTQKHLRCHYCGLVRSPYLLCPQCGGSQMALQGVGTQRVEEDLKKLFPEARVARMDLDTTSRKGAHGKILRAFGSREVDILLGTQMVAKGLDFPHVTLVGVISADTQMLLPDFRSSERTFQLLTQVSGRAGRSDLLGEVVIQTRQPDHYALVHVLDHNYQSFFEEEVEQRRELMYPPFSRLVLVEAKGTDEPSVRKASERFAALLKKEATIVLGPAPAVISKIRMEYRWHLVIKIDKTSDPGGQGLRSILHRVREAYGATPVSGVRVTVDVDPAGLM